jgi:hypothetical protein
MEKEAVASNGHLGMDVNTAWKPALVPTLLPVVSISW